MDEPVWTVTNKGDARCRAMADRHYTRQSIGHPQWTRPGYSAVLYACGPDAEACFVWWRPKWEDGRPGTARKDGLRCLECTLFRREGGSSLPLASSLIRSAVDALTWPAVRAALRLDNSGYLTDGLITGVGSAKTASRRSKGARPGECFRRAGWMEFAKNVKNCRADVWLHLDAPSREQQVWMDPPRDEDGACGWYWPTQDAPDEEEA